MSSAKEMLIAVFKSEFAKLNEFFIKQIIPRKAFRADADFFCDYDFEKIKYLFGRYDSRFTNDDELFETLLLLFADNFSGFLRCETRELLYIPVFIYFLNNNLINSDQFYNLCMKVHLSKNKEKLFLDKEFRDLVVPFNIEVVDVLEKVLSEPNFSVNMVLIIELLDYIDYERFINGLGEDEYYKYLKCVEVDLLAYMSFLASDSLLEEFHRNRKNDTRDYKYSKYRLTNDGLNLMSCFINTNVEECKNNFLRFRILEERLKNAATLEDRKNNMMVAFTYRRYPSGDFYDCFREIELTIDDLLLFINHCEESGIVLSPRQLDNLLASYRNRYLDKNNMMEEFSFLVQSAKEAFYDYRKTKYAFLPNEFIRYYNSNYLGNNFKGFNCGVNSKLTRDMYELIINGNNLIGFECLADSKSFKAYMSDRKIKRCTINFDNEEYLKAQHIYDKYYDMLTSQCAGNDFTIDYVIRKNVSGEDMLAFLDLKNWFEQYNCGVWNCSSEVQERTLVQLQADLASELRCSPFSVRFDILERYNDYVSNDNSLEEISPKLLFADTIQQYEKEFIAEHGIEMYHKFMKDYVWGGNLLRLLDNLGLAPEDINLVFGSLCEDFAIKACRFRRTAISKLDCSGEGKPADKAANLDHDEINLVGSQDSNLCQDDNENSSLNSLDEYSDGLVEDKVVCCAHNSNLTGSIKKDASELLNDLLFGVKKSDGTIRPFTYLDYKLGTDMTLEQFRKSISPEQRKCAKVAQFIEQHLDLVRFEEADILAEKYVVMVDGKLHETTMEEKRAAIAFINDMGFPHEFRLYGLIIKASLNGDLVIGTNSDAKAKILVKENMPCK